MNSRGSGVIESAIRMGLTWAMDSALITVDGPMTWTATPDGRVVGQVPADVADAEVAAVVRAWARYLGLVETTPVVPGSIETAGQVDGWQITVWGVTDRELFEAAGRGAR